MRFYTLTFIVLAIFAVIVQPVSGQAYNTQYNGASVPSIAGMSYGKIADIPVNTYTGTGNVSVPLHVVRDGGLQVPISLNYHTAGLPVYTLASTVGLGWNLQAGGIVSRTIQGLPDEDEYGYYHVGSSTTASGPPIWNASGGPTTDSEPDIFTYSANGMAGKFFLDANNNIIQVPKTDNHIEVKFVGPANGDKTISEITITNPQGVKYQFGGSLYFDLSYLTSTGDKQRVAWHLIRIESADGFNGITFEYKKHHYEMEVPSSCPVNTEYVKDNGDKRFISVNSCGPPPFNYETQSFESWVPWLITPDTQLEQVVFGTSSRDDLATNSYTTHMPLKIHSMSVNGGTPYAYDFTQNYFRSSSSTSDPDKRLRLQSVQKKDAPGSTTLTEPPYIFAYNGETYGDGAQFFPAQMDKNVDHWGYYNYNSGSGNDNNSLSTIVPYSAIQRNGELIDFGSAERDSYESAMLIGTLKEVTYPTGGSMELSYEANTYKKGSLLSKTLTSTPTTSCGGFIATNTTSISVTSDMMNGGDVSLCLSPYEFPTCQYPRSPFLYLEVKNSGGTVVSNRSFNASVYQCIYLDPSDLNVSAGNTYTFELTSGDGVGDFKWEYMSNFSNIPCGGLRIDETTVSDGISGNNNDIVKTYHYEDTNNPGISSGELYRIPQYVFALNHYTAIWLENSPVALSSFNGYHIGYERVVVKQAGQGETVYEYATETSGSSGSGFPSPPAQYDVNGGSLSTVLIKKENGTGISSSSTVRNTNDQYSEYGNSSSTGYFHHTNRRLAVYNGSSEVFDEFMTQYSIRTNVYRPSQSTNELDGKTDVTTYIYSSATQNLLPHWTETENSDGIIHKTQTFYTPSHGYGDVRNDFKDRNMIQLPYETKIFRDDVWVGGNRIFYAFYDCNGQNPSYSEYPSCDQHPKPRLQQRYKTAYDAGGNLQVAGWSTDSQIDEYTSDGLVKKARNENWLPTEYTYDEKRRIKEVKFDQHIKTYGYDDENDRGYLLDSVTNVDKTVTLYSYDNLSRLKSVTDDCKNIETTYDYGFGWGGTNINYINMITDYPSPDSKSDLDVVIKRNYLDGLGRKIETVARNQGPSSNQDVLHAVEYDQYGRISRTFEPHLRTNNYGNYRTPDDGFGTWDYTTHTYEASPLGRKKSVTPPSWYPTEYEYVSNTSTDAVKIDAGSSTYSAGKLIKHIVKDGNSNLLITFIDRLGRKILSRRTDKFDTQGKRLDTYYIYDGKGQLSQVVPPGASVSSSDLVYSYRYDDEGKTIYKKIPGAEPITYKYNNRDLLAAYQDGNLAKPNVNYPSGRWYGYNFDAYGRPESEGFYAGSFSNDFDQLTLTEELITTAYGTAPHEIDKPKTIRTKILDTTNDWLETTNAWSTCGLLEEQKGNNHLYLSPVAGDEEVTSYAYDGGDNLVESVYSHRVSGATTIDIKAEHHLDHIGRMEYDYFQVGNGVNQRISKTYYDEKGNISAKRQGLTGLPGTRRYLQEINYDYLPNGMLAGINIDGLTGSQTGLPSNGGTATMPSPNLPGTSSYDEKDLFYLELYRDNTPNISGGGSSAPARYNGDISYVASQVRGRKQMLFGVNYDDYDRMTRARFYERTTKTSTASYSSAYEEAPGYDSRGNIQTLYRQGVYESGGRYYHEEIDDLEYFYNNANQLNDINDDLGTSRGYDPGSGSYDYDENGNLDHDPSKGINIEYNHLNLPTVITWSSPSDDRMIKLTYNASGTLLTRTTYTDKNDLNTAVDRHFIGGIEYVGSSMESVHHSEGRVYFGTGSERYDYAIQDHLGNTRLLYSDTHGATVNDAPDGIIDVPSEIIQENHYYPFGMKMEGPWMSTSVSQKTAYQYNSIEHVDDFDLNVNMATYRTLDPVVGQWWQIDPEAENFQSLSPYVAMMNSPVVYNDPNGDNPILFGAGFGVLGNGIGNVLNGKSFFDGAGQAAVWGAIGGDVSSNIGNAAMGLSYSGVSQFGVSVFQAGAHALSGGLISAAQGGRFLSGAASGAFSSAVSSGIASLGGGGALQILGGTLSGGFGSVISGGSFLKGALQGAITSGLNHAAHALFSPPFDLETAKEYFRHAFGNIPDYLELIIVNGALPSELAELGYTLDKDGVIVNENGGKVGAVTVPSSGEGRATSKIYLSKLSFGNARRLVHNMAHEYFHARLFNAGIHGKFRHHATIYVWDRIFNIDSKFYKDNFGASLGKDRVPSDMNYAPFFLRTDF